MHARFAAVAIGVALAASPVLVAPMGRLAPAFALLIVLPALAVSLEAFGWSRELGDSLRKIRSPRRRLLGAYGLWLAVSTVLSLDTAATIGASVGVDVAGSDHGARRRHLSAAILGSNVGSLLFPFSNLTNLVLAAATGIGMATFVATTWLPQIAAALGVAVVLAARVSPRDADLASDLEPETAALDPAAGSPGLVASSADTQDLASRGTEPPAPVAALVALAGAAGAIAFGFSGRDMAVPFAITSGVLTAAGITVGRAEPRDIVASLPVVALLIVGAAAALVAPAMSATAGLPLPRDDAGGLLTAVAVGGLLSVTINNLPAAAFGAVWLGHAPVAVVVAYLIGTNVVAVATPHGSAATMLARSVGARRGTVLTWLSYVRGGWLFALAGAVPAFLALWWVSGSAR